MTITIPRADLNRMLHFERFKQQASFQIGNNGSAFDVILNNLRRNNPISNNNIHWEIDISFCFNDHLEKAGILRVNLPTPSPYILMRALKREDNIEAVRDQVSKQALEASFFQITENEVRHKFRGISRDEKFPFTIVLDKPFIANTLVSCNRRVDPFNKILHLFSSDASTS